MTTSSQDTAVGGGPGPGTAPTDLDEFRAYARSWAKANLEERSEAPPSLGSTSDDELRARVAEHRAIQARLFAAGLAGIRYPAEYGGQGLSAAHQAVFIDETGSYQMPTQLSVTLGILGPTVLDYGTEEQKRRYIPGMLSGQGIWVQLLSEPSGGSDMAGANPGRPGRRHVHRQRLEDLDNRRARRRLRPAARAHQPRCHQAPWAVDDRDAA